MKAYLSYPITIELLGKVYDDLHITVKYIGSAPYTIEDLDARLKGMNTDLLDSSPWKCVKFNPKTHVLELTRPCANAVAVREAVDSIAPNDYAGWRAHITVPKPLWEQIRKLGAIWTETVTKVGPLTLKDNGVVVKTWGIKA